MQKASSSQASHITDFMRKSREGYKKEVESMLKHPLSREEMVNQEKRRMKEQTEKKSPKQ